jgi:hypothetical protein
MDSCQQYVEHQHNVQALNRGEDQGYRKALEQAWKDQKVAEEKLENAEADHKAEIDKLKQIISELKVTLHEYTIQFVCSPCFF